MKTCLLSTTSSYGGAERHLVSLARVLARRGHETSIVVLGKNVFGVDEGLLNGIPLFEVPRSSKDVTRFDMSAFGNLLKQLHPDLCVYAKGDVVGNGASLELMAAFRSRRYATIEHSTPAPLPLKRSSRHAGFVPGLGLWWYRKRIRASVIARCPRLTVAVSSAAKDSLIRNYGFRPERIKVVHNGVDTSIFRREQSMRAKVRAELGVDENTCVMGAVGRFHSVKRFDRAIEFTAQLIKERGPDSLRLVLVGDGPEADRLKTLAHDLGVSKQVTFVPFTARPWEFLSAIDLFLMPSLTEGHPIALLEAMACECVPIASDVGGISEVLTNSELGWLVPAQDDAAFVAAMREAMGTERDVRSRMGNVGRQRIVEFFDEQRQLAKYVDLFEAMAPATNGACGSSK